MLAETPPRAPPGPQPGTVTFELVNRAGAPRYVPFVRFWTESLSVERQEGGAWVPVATEEPMCGVECPADGSTPTCGPCYPPTPRPGGRVLGRIEHVWDGTIYELRQGRPDWCQCYRAVPAPLGRYRIGLCVRPSVTCADPAACEPDERGILWGYPDGDEACFHAELDLTTAPRTVTLEVR